MLHRLAIKGVTRALTSARSACAPGCAYLAGSEGVRQLWQPPQGWAAPMRRLSDSASAATAPAAEKRKPDWPPGTPAPGREQTVGEAFAAMQHHARGTRKVKASVLNRILERVSSEEELKYATLGLEIFKNQGIDLHTKTATLFVKACCKAGSPQTAVEALGEATKYGLDAEGVVSAHRFNYLLSQLYRAGDSETFARAVVEARSRQQSLNPRSHTLIAKFEAEERAKEEEAARAKAEEERAAKEEEERAKREEEEKELKAKEAAEEEARLKVKEEEEARKAEEEAKAKEAESAAVAAAVEASAPGDDGDSPTGDDGSAEQGAAEAQDTDAKR